MQLDIDREINSQLCQNPLVDLDYHAGNIAGLCATLIDQEVGILRRDPHLSPAECFHPGLLNQPTGAPFKGIFEKWSDMPCEGVDFLVKCFVISRSRVDVGLVIAEDSDCHSQDDL